VSDIFQEVEEDVRRERLEKLWKEYGDYVIAAASILIIGAAGYQLWRYHDAQARAKASNDYMAAQQLLDSGQSHAAAEAFARLSQDAPSGYAKISELQQADALLASGDRPHALMVYKRIADGGDEMLSAIARIRIGWATAETASKTELQADLAPLTAANSPWRPMAREILAYADYRSGEEGQALVEYKSLSQDTNAPPGVRQRAHAMATMLAAGGDRNFGSVPVPKMPLVPRRTVVVPPGAAAPAAPSAATTPSAGSPPAGSPPAPASTAPAPPTPQGSPPK